MSRQAKTQTDGDPPGDKGGEEARSHNPLLAPPPRPVPPALPLYLILLATQFGWLFLGVGMFAFWFNCAFGADLKAALFLAPTRIASGTVIGFEQTPLIEGTGTSYIAGNLRHATSIQPIFAVHYAYPLPGGGVGRGTSYQGAAVEDGPMVETPAVTAPVETGLRVPVQYVRALPAASRIQGMRANVYPPYALGVLVFALIGAALLRPAPRNLRRVRFLLASGVEDTKRRTLEDPNGRLLNLPLEDPAPRLLGIRGGQFHAPGPLAWAKVLLLPVGGLLASAAYLCYHWGAIAYTWHTLMGGT